MVLKPGAVKLPRGFAILVVVSERLLGSGLGQSDSPKPVGPVVREEPRWEAYGPVSRPRAQPHGLLSRSIRLWPSVARRRSGRDCPTPFRDSSVLDLGSRAGHAVRRAADVFAE